MYARVEKPSLKNKKKVSKKEIKIDYRVYKVGEVLEPLEKYPKEIKDAKKYNIYSNLKVAPLIDKAKKLTTKKELREMMRLTGRRLKFTELNISILAVVDDHLVIER